MHAYHKQAEDYVKAVIADLQRLLPSDGDDISYYNPGILNSPIATLIDAKILMACANEAEGRNAVEPVKGE